MRRGSGRSWPGLAGEIVREGEHQQCGQQAQARAEQVADVAPGDCRGLLECAESGEQHSGGSGEKEVEMPVEDHRHLGGDHTGDDDGQNEQAELDFQGPVHDALYQAYECTLSVFG